MIAYVLLYVYMICVSVLFSLMKDVRKRKILLSVCLFVPLIFLCAFKSISVGSDSPIYLETYKYLREKPLGTTYRQMETGFCVFAGFFGHIGFPFSGFLLVCYAIVFAPISVLAARFSKHPELVALFTFLFQFLNFSISALRQAVSIGFGLFGLLCFLLLSKRRKHLYVVFIPLGVGFLLISTLLHRSGLLFFGFVALFFISHFWKMSFSTCFFLFWVMSILAPYLYGAVFSAVGEGIWYDPPRNRFFLNHGLSIYYLLALGAFFALFGNARVSGFLVSAERHLACVPVLRRFPVGAAKGEVIESHGKGKEHEAFFSNAFHFSILLSVVSLVSVSFSRLTISVLPLTFVFVSNSLGSIKETRIKALCFMGVAVSLPIYFYFASIKSGYLGISPYKMGFYI